MKIVVGVIIDQQQRVLLTQRAAEAEHGGLWEFPGGKVEANETAEAAINREIKEEIGLDVHQAEFLTAIYHQYPQKAVTLHVYIITEFTGKAVCRENQQDLRWVSPADLVHYPFPDANYQIIMEINKRFAKF